MLVAPTAVRAADTPWFRGVNAWGGSGVWRTEAAVAPVPGEFVFNLRESFSILHDVFIPGDAVSTLESLAGMTWTPVLGLQVGLNGSLVNATYANLLTYNIRALGNPQVRVKYGHAVAPGLALGAAVQLALPTLQPADPAPQFAYVAAAQGLVSFSPGPLLELHLNVGFTWDRSAAAFIHGIDAPQRFVLGINDTNHLDYAVGAVGRIVSLFIDPFLEVSGALGGASPTAPFTARVTPGLRLDTAYGAPLEAAVGAHLRLTGEPSSAAGYAGLPQWEMFVQVALHVFGSSDSAAVWSHRGCTLDAECAQDLLCTGGVCASPPPRAVHRPLPPPLHAEPAPQAPPPPPPPVTVITQVRGRVRVQAGSKPVMGATILILGTHVRWSSDANGNFGGSLPEGAYDVLVTAKQYGELRRRIDLRNGETLTWDVELKPVKKPR